MRTIEKQITVYLDGRNDSARVGDIAIEKAERLGDIYYILTKTTGPWLTVDRYPVLKRRDFEKIKRTIRADWGIEL